MVHDLKEIIDNAWDNREILKDKDTQIAIKTIIDEIDMGTLRAAEPMENGWMVERPMN